MRSDPNGRAGTIFAVGSVNMDIVIPAPRLPSLGETLRGGDAALFAGGKGANQACAAARLGAKVQFIGKVGKDPFGKTVRESLDACHVDHRGLIDDERATGTAMITVLPNGENAILLSPGANDAVSPAEAIARLGNLERSSIVLLQLEIPLDTVRAAALAAREQGATVILDPAPFCPLPADLLRSASIITPNQTEAAQLLGRPGWEISSVEEAQRAASDLVQLGSKAVILTLGRLGCFVQWDRVSEHLPAYEVQAVDSTAAGDTFNGALAAALASQMDLLDAADFANAAAAISVTRRGAQASLPSIREVENMRTGVPTHNAS